MVSSLSNQFPEKEKWSKFSIQLRKKKKRIKQKAQGLLDYLVRLFDKLVF
jgi:hypothetical protein